MTSVDASPRPPGAPRKHLSADVRREQLLAAALRVMKRDGVRAATTRAICAEAGMPHGAFHYCFRSKQELYADLLCADIDSSLDAAWPEISPDATPAENIRTLLRAFWAVVEADPEGELVLFELIGRALREPDLRELPGWEHEASLAKAVEHLDRLAVEARVEYTIDIRLLGEMVLAVLDGLASTWLSHRDDTLARATLDQFATMLATVVRPAHA
ncbi:TetR/AcrR family transcriptional regulator [Oerskovia turbata]